MTVKRPRPRLPKGREEGRSTDLPSPIPPRTLAMNVTPPVGGHPAHHRLARPASGRRHPAARPRGTRQLRRSARQGTKRRGSRLSPVALSCRRSVRWRLPRRSLQTGRRRRRFRELSFFRRVTAAQDRALRGIRLDGSRATGLGDLQPRLRGESGVRPPRLLFSRSLDDQHRWARPKQGKAPSTRDELGSQSGR
jgi:hypothetical protein